eukprot:CAMPEP_0198259734 /NCGR_PEP_ID=MMETSP1447-20131203/8849_1 /TAXON_ID=420782 /ORGANISM="Chaetoceros dichaeta, Strain CCMP1751" /LENGTH=80 /DNA_ID=CAMNT_0043947191 /DNA_START=61 /DNA_END=299 /DNA_ORIENTATION=+
MIFKGRAVIVFLALLQKGFFTTASDGSDKDEKLAASSNPVNSAEEVSNTTKSPTKSPGEKPTNKPKPTNSPTKKPGTKVP